MENASKALIMAGGVLIGVLILSLWVYIFVSFGTEAARIEKQNEQTKILQFNTQFTSYEGKDGITIYDVITVAGLAKENNDFYEDDSKYHVVVELKTNNGITIRNIQNKNENEKIKLINDDKNKIQNANPNLPQYNCGIEYNSSTGRVSKVIFTYKK